MKLSVVVLCCDKDYTCVEKQIAAINEHVKIEHEIVIVDNREKNKDKPLNEDGAIVYTEGKNMMPFEGRRKAVMNAVNGDYVWFVDVDDEICNVESCDGIDMGVDMVVFNYMVRRADKLMPWADAIKVPHTVSDAPFLHDYWKRKDGNMVWNKFYRRDLLMKIYTGLPDGLEICQTEDCVINILLMPALRTVRYDNHFWYVYDQNVSDSARLEYKDLEPMKRVMTGVLTGLGVLEAYLPWEVQQASEIYIIALMRGACEYYIKKYEVMADDIKDDFVKLVLDMFPVEVVRECLKYTKGVDEHTKRSMRKVITRLTI